jgi:hypothetical protein
MFPAHRQQACALTSQLALLLDRATRERGHAHIEE